MDTVRAAAARASARCSATCSTSRRLDNVPRQRPKFVGFVKNSLRMRDEKAIEEIWAALDAVKGERAGRGARPPRPPRRRPPRPRRPRRSRPRRLPAARPPSQPEPADAPPAARGAESARGRRPRRARPMRSSRRSTRRSSPRRRGRATPRRSRSSRAKVAKLAKGCRSGGRPRRRNARRAARSCRSRVRPAAAPRTLLQTPCAVRPSCCRPVSTRRSIVLLAAPRLRARPLISRSYRAEGRAARRRARAHPPSRCRRLARARAAATVGFSPTTRARCPARRPRSRRREAAAGGPMAARRRPPPAACAPLAIADDLRRAPRGVHAYPRFAPVPSFCANVARGRMR